MAQTSFCKYTQVCNIIVIYVGIGTSGIELIMAHTVQPKCTQSQRNGTFIIMQLHTGV